MNIPPLNNITYKFASSFHKIIKIMKNSNLTEGRKDNVKNILTTMIRRLL